MARKKTKSSKPKRTAARIDLFGPPSLLFGENEATYNDLFERVNEALKPTDIFEVFAARDLTNGMMDSIRFSRLKQELINANMHRGMENVLRPLCQLSVHLKMNRITMLEVDEAAAGWQAGEPGTVTAVEKMLIDANLSMGAVVAETVSCERDGYEALDRMATNAELRRYATLREVERRREVKRDAAPPEPMVRFSPMAEIEKVKANDNEKRSVANADVVDIQVEQADAAGSSHVVQRELKAAKE